MHFTLILVAAVAGFSGLNQAAPTEGVYKPDWSQDIVVTRQTVRASAVTVSTTIQPSTSFTTSPPVTRTIKASTSKPTPAPAPKTTTNHSLTTHWVKPSSSQSSKTRGVQTSPTSPTTSLKSSSTTTPAPVKPSSTSRPTTSSTKQAPSPTPQTETCTKPLVRKSWQSLTHTERQSYLTAELCLMHTTSNRDNDPSTKTVFDELIKSHQLRAAEVHYGGLFAAFHRLHMVAHEALLRDVCGYKGAQPYWDETADSGAFSESEILKDFGGDGVGEERCIAEGPFARYQLTVGPAHSNTLHCISRRVSDSSSRTTSKEDVEECLAIEHWPTALNCIEGGLHSGGHNGVGGVMADGVASPGDPLFYLHHTWVDRIWAMWQQRWGSDVKGGTFVEGRGVAGDTWLNMSDVVKGATVAEVAKVGEGRTCYVYQ